MADGLKLSYLVVTRPLFTQALPPFVNWKTSQGYRVGVVTVDWLDRRFSGRHVAERMKTGMHTLRRRTGLRYALLVGDTETKAEDSSIDAVLQSHDLKAPWNVPTGFYSRKDVASKEMYQSDVYFVEDSDWDPQNTGLNPMPQQNTGTGGEGRFDATLFLGRWSVRRPEEIAPIFAKTQAVSPANKIFLTSDAALSKGAPEREDCLRMPPPSPNDPHEFLCYNDSMGTVRLRLFENNAPWLTTESLFVDLNNQTQVDELFNRLASSEGVVVGQYHGMLNCWMEKFCPTLKTTLKTIRTFDNFHFKNNFPLLEAEGCLIGAFYWGSTDTVTESLLKVSTGPAVVTSLPPNIYMFMSSLREGQPVGDAFWRSGAYYFIWGNPIHLFGDPSLQVMQGPKKK